MKLTNSNGSATGTVFTSETTNHGNNENGPAGLPLMSEAGKKMAANSAPNNALKVAVGTSGVDRAMRGKQ